MTYKPEHRNPLVVLTLILTLVTSCSTELSNEPFNKSEWNTSVEFSVDKRVRMVNDLTTNYLYKGMHYNKVKQLLGTNDSYRTEQPGNLLYTLYERYDVIDPVETKNLELFFEDSLLTSAELSHWMSGNEPKLTTVELKNTEGNIR